MPAFVLLRHECPPLFEKPSHWDLMLEMDGVLRTWELRELPAAWLDRFAGRAAEDAAVAKRIGVGPRVAESSSNSSAGQDSSSRAVMAKPLDDHRLAYLDYEGPLTGDRGTVCRCERGTYELLSSGKNGSALLLVGEVLRGKIELSLSGQSWQLVLA